MPTAKATKASDKAQICRKFVTAAQKMYGKSVPKLDQPVLETFLFAVLLEDNSWDAAEAAYKKLISSYFDLNEIRVSTVTELENTLAPLREADWKGLRIRSILRFLFESTYSFDWEKFRRLTQEVAVKTLKKVNDVSPFVRDFALQHLLGSHIVCLDTSMLRAAIWLGLVPADHDHTAAGEFLKAGLKKSDVAEFCHMLRCVATDPKFYDRFFEQLPPDIDMNSVTDRLLEVQSPTKRKVVKPPDKPVKAAEATAKAVPKKVAAKSVTGKPEIAPKKDVAGKTGKPPAKQPPAPAKPARPAAPAAGKAATGKPSKPAPPAPAKSTTKKPLPKKGKPSK